MLAKSHGGTHKQGILSLRYKHSLITSTLACMWDTFHRMFASHLTLAHPPPRTRQTTHHSPRHGPPACLLVHLRPLS